MGAAAARDGPSAIVNPHATPASIFAKEDKFGAHNYKPASDFVRNILCDHLKRSSLTILNIYCSSVTLFHHRFRLLSVAGRACTCGTWRERSTLTSSAPTRVNLVNSITILLQICTVWGGRLSKRFFNMFSGSSPCLLGQHGSCSSAYLPVELSENMLLNLLLDLLPQTVDIAQTCT